MVKVEFLGPIGQESVEVQAASLRELSDLLKQDKSVASWLPECAVALNDRMVSDLETALKPGDRVTILPPVCGG